MKAIQSLFHNDVVDDQALDVPTATTVLLLEAAGYDETFGQDERDEIKRILVRRLRLSEVECDGLIQSARRHREGQADFFHYTRHINEIFEPEDRFEFLVEVWRVVLADDVITFEEDQFMRKLVNLLRLDRVSWVQARDEARRRMGQGT